jgi:hypothetical protein
MPKAKEKIEVLSTEILGKVQPLEVLKYWELLKKEDRTEARVHVLNRDCCTTVKLKIKLVNGTTIIKEVREIESMSISNKRFVIRRPQKTILYTKKGVYYKGYKGLLVAATMQQVIDKDEFAALIEVHPNLEFIKEMHRIVHGTTINVVLNKKLLTPKKLLNHVMKIDNYNKCKEILSIDNMIGNHVWFNIKRLDKWLDNMVNFNPELLKPETVHIFLDAQEFAHKLNKRINCAWSVRRLNEVHDEWAAEIMRYTTEDRMLEIHPVHYDIEELMKHKGLNAHLITNTVELAMEGKRMRHCVGTYTGTIERSKHGIFHVEGYTLELAPQIAPQIIDINQFRGLQNANAPDDLLKRVADVVTEYNRSEQFMLKHDSLFKHNQAEYGNQVHRQVERNLLGVFDVNRCAAIRLAQDEEQDLQIAGVEQNDWLDDLPL